MNYLYKNITNYNFAEILNIATSVATTRLDMFFFHYKGLNEYITSLLINGYKINSVYRGAPLGEKRGPAGHIENHAIKLFINFAETLRKSAISLIPVSCMERTLVWGGLPLKF